MLRILISGVVGGIVFFFWGFLVHVVFQFYSDVIRSVPDENAIRAVVQAEIPESGAYFFPAYPQHDSEMTELEVEALTAQFNERHEAGPIGLLFVQKEGMKAMQPMIFIRGLGIFVLVGLVASLLLAAAAPAMPSYVGRVLFILSIGVVVVLFSDISAWNWWHMPGDYTRTHVIDHLVAWALAGAAMAGIVKPLGKPAEPQAP